MYNKKDLISQNVDLNIKIIGKWSTLYLFDTLYNYNAYNFYFLA